MAVNKVVQPQRTMGSLSPVYLGKFSQKRLMFVCWVLKETMNWQKWTSALQAERISQAGSVECAASIEETCWWGGWQG